jgi:acyl carrier protein
VNPAASATTASAGADVRALVDKVFFDLTGIREIDPELDLTDQGLDSLSATEFVSTLEKELKIEIDSDILFENPFVDQLVGALQQAVPGAGDQHQDDGAMDREKVARLVSAIFYELTNVKEIDADLALTDQGLDSLSGTELLSTIEKELKIEMDSDILFDHPLYDQLVDQIHARVSG